MVAFWRLLNLLREAAQEGKLKEGRRRKRGDGGKALGEAGSELKGD